MYIVSGYDHISRLTMYSLYRVLANRKSALRLPLFESKLLAQSSQVSLVRGPGLYNLQLLMKDPC
jgi:hypothetical protein